MRENSACAIIGPSGCGKSTFVHLLAGLLTPQHGQIEIFGQDLGALKETARDRYRGANIGFIFQKLHLFSALTVRENLLLAQRLSRCEPNATHIDDLLGELGLGELSHRRPNDLSQGQAQRVAVARSLAHSPRLIIADEPTSALDDDNASKTLEMLCNATQHAGAALMIVTHDARAKGRLGDEFDLEALA